MPRKKANVKRKAPRRRNPSAVSVAHMEQIARNESVGQKACETLDTPCSIHIHSKRRVLADADGISAKAAIDGLVHCGLLTDDTTQYVKEVSYSQEKSKEEETIITIYKEPENASK